MRKVVVVVQDGAEPFGLGSICEVWAEPYHPEDDNPVFDFVVCTPRPGRVRGASGFDLFVEHGLEELEDADLVCIVPKRRFKDPQPEVAAAVRAAYDRGALIFAHCTAAFVLGEAGLLEGRRCTTHWRHVDDLAEAFPEAKVDADVLYVQDGTITTGAGSAAGLDEQRDVVHDDGAGRGRRLDLGRPGPPPGMDDGLQTAALDGVGEDQRAHRRPVEVALGGEHGGSERVDDGGEPVGPACDHLARQHVGVDHDCSELRQDRRHRALARGDAPGQPDPEDALRRHGRILSYSVAGQQANWRRYCCGLTPRTRVKW